MSGYPSPPSDLGGLRLIGARVAFDIDVDYMMETTNKCYDHASFIDIPIHIGLPRGGSMDAVLSLAEKVKPFLITVSEVKQEYLKDLKSRTSRFPESLKELDYDITFGCLWSDREAEVAFRKQSNLTVFLNQRLQETGHMTKQERIEACREFLTKRSARK